MKMAKNISKEAKNNFVGDFSIVQVIATALVVALVIVAVVSGIKALAPAAPAMSDSDLAAHQLAKNNNPNLGYGTSSAQAAAPQAAAQAPAYH